MSEPFRPDDDLVSSVLDGEATADERARVDADPALSARLAEFRRVRALVGDTVPPRPDTVRNAVIAAAVAERKRSDQVVTALHRPRDTRPFLAVAAGVLLVLLAAGFVADRLGQSDDSGSSSGVALDAGDESGDRDSGAGGAATESDDTAAGVAPLPQADGLDLGAVADEAALREALQVRAALPGGEAEDSTTTGTSLEEGSLDTLSSAGDPERGDSIECGVRLEEADPTLTGFLLRATAGYAGTPAVVYVFPGESGGQQVVVVSAAACEVLDAFAL